MKLDDLSVTRESSRPRPAGATLNVCIFKQDSLAAIDNDEQEFGYESGPALVTVFTATKIDFILYARLNLTDNVSICPGYKFDLSRINKWDPYVAASNNSFTSINYDF